MTATPSRLSRAEQAAATRARLLEAASAEFDEHGFAGGRTERIGQRAGVDKRLVHHYFTDKAGIFDAVVQRDVEAMIDAVPFTPDDLPGYAVALLDHLEAHPAILRLFGWRNLETGGASAVERASYEGKLRQLQAAADRAGFTPADLLVLLLGLVSSWASASPALRELGTDAAGDRRAALRRAVERLLGP
jgi:AcrR family transcriptional regulator